MIELALERTRKTSGALSLVTVILNDLIAVWLVLALIVGVWRASMLHKATRAEKAEKMLSWMLLVAVGFQSLYTAFFQIVAPAPVSALVGYANSPFLFEVAMANFGDRNCRSPLVQEIP